MEIYAVVPSEPTRDALCKLGDLLARLLARRLLHVACCTKIKKGQSHDRNWPATCGEVFTFGFDLRECGPVPVPVTG